MTARGRSRGRNGPGDQARGLRAPDRPVRRRRAAHQTSPTSAPRCPKRAWASTSPTPSTTSLLNRHNLIKPGPDQPCPAPRRGDQVHAQGHGRHRQPPSYDERRPRARRVGSRTAATPRRRVKATATGRSTTSRAKGNGRTEFVLKNSSTSTSGGGPPGRPSTPTLSSPDGDTGVVCFITTSGYLRGPGFKGMREYLRRTASEGCRIIDVSLEGMRPDVATRIFSACSNPW